jgi:IS30 family transposase
MMRRGKTDITTGQPRGQIVDAVSIRERPAEVEDRAVPGHWEGDLLSGSKNSHIATLVERRSRFVMLVKVKGKDKASVVSALVRKVKTLPSELISSITWDRGTELAQHKRFTVATDVIKSTSAIRAAPGSAEQMKIRMGYCDNTSLMEPTYQS